MKETLLVIILLSVVTFTHQACPPGWRQSALDASKCYLVVVSKSIWFEAMASCAQQAAGATLTSVTSAYEVYALNGQPDLNNQCVSSQARTAGKWKTEPCGTENCFICELYTSSSGSSTTASTIGTTPPLPPARCNLDIIFVFENSELVDTDGRLFELGAMTETITNYASNGTIDYYGDHIGIVFFSAMDNFNGAEFNRSGILINPSNSNPASFTYSQAISLLETFDKNYLLGGASDILLGLNMTATLLAKRKLENTNNIPVVVLMGRGAFHDGDNCCDSPVAFAQNMRAAYGVQMKGVVVGHLTNGNIMTSITGTTNLVPNTDYFGDGRPYEDGVIFADQIENWLEQVRRNSNCYTPPQMPYCKIYMDIVIVVRYTRRRETFLAIRNFITTMLLGSASQPGTLGGVEQNTVADRLTRIGLVAYDSQHVNPPTFDLTSYQYISDYVNSINGMTWPGGESLRPDLLSDALDSARIMLFSQARPYAYRSVLVFSDQFSREDLADSIHEWNLLKDLYARIFAVGIGLRPEDEANFSQFTDGRVSLTSGTGLDPTKPTAIIVANDIRNFVCNGGTLPPTLT